MKRWLLRLAIAAGLMALLFSQLSLGAAYAEVFIPSYVVTFEIVPNSAGALRDLRATLEITYDVRGESKSSGFKFVGTTKIENVSVTDLIGRPLKFKVEHLDEERIEWSFPAVRDGRKTVVAQFTIPNALQGNLERNTFSAEWVKNWKVKVDAVTYRFIFPEDYEYETVNTSPSNYHERVIDGRRAITIGMDELASTSFGIAFSPGLVEGKAPPKANRTPRWQCLCLGIGLPTLFIGMLIRHKRTTGHWPRLIDQSRGGGGGGSEGGGCSGGGCGGGGCGDGGCGG